MNERLYNKMVDMSSFLTDPLWDVYNDAYNGYLGEPLLGVMMLGLIASTYPGQVASHIGSFPLIANQMISRDDWWKIVVGLFIGKLIGIYVITILILMDGFPINLVEKLGIANVPFFLLLGGMFFNQVRRGRKRKVEILEKKQFALWVGLIIGFILSLIIDPSVYELITIYIPWLTDESLFYTIVIPFLFTLATFLPVLAFSVIGYGFNLDVRLKGKSDHKLIPYFFGFVYMFLALNQFLLFW
jgi:hypothetical protein